MRIHFWGVRGSIATPLSNGQLQNRLEEVLRQAIRYGVSCELEVESFVNKLPWPLKRTGGGDTACVEVDTGGNIIILDAGSGIRRLGLDLKRRYKDQPLHLHILISHTHWDHICGFPFFLPALDPKNRITFYGPQEGLEARIRHQQDWEHFPLPIDAMAAEINFVHLDKRGELLIGDTAVQSFPLKHPGGCFGYRLTRNGKSLVYATDSEYKGLADETGHTYTDFFRNADILIFDAQYTWADSIEKENWGHSNAFVGVEMALESGVKNLVLTHHDPEYDDEKLWSIFNKAKEHCEMEQKGRSLNLILAYEGLEVKL